MIENCSENLDTILRDHVKNPARAGYTKIRLHAYFEQLYAPPEGFVSTVKRKPL